MFKFKKSVNFEIVKEFKQKNKRLISLKGKYSTGIYNSRNITKQGYNSRMK